MRLIEKDSESILDHLRAVIKTDSHGALSHCIHAGGPNVNKTHLFCTECVELMQEITARRDDGVSQDDTFERLPPYCSASLAQRATMKPLHFQF